MFMGPLPIIFAVSRRMRQSQENWRLVDADLSLLRRKKDSENGKQMSLTSVPRKI